MNFHVIGHETHIKIDTILSIHYFECKPELVIPGRRYDFLELIYVEKGSVTIDSNSGIFHLKKGDILFHNANHIHSMTQTSSVTPVLATAAFIASSYTKQFFENKIFQTERPEELLMNELLMEAYDSYSSDVENVQLLYMTTAAAAPFAAEQMLRLHLEHLLIHLIRNSLKKNSPSNEPAAEQTRYLRSQNDDVLFNRIVSYMESNVNTQLTVEKICQDNLISRAKLQKLFKEKADKSVIDYFLKKKIEVAKLLISENMLNFTQISEHLGYTSVHYFSRQFKKITGVTPSEYASSNNK